MTPATPERSREPKTRWTRAILFALVPIFGLVSPGEIWAQVPDAVITATANATTTFNNEGGHDNSYPTRDEAVLAAVEALHEANLNDFDEYEYGTIVYQDRDTGLWTFVPPDTSFDHFGWDPTDAYETVGVEGGQATDEVHTHPSDALLGFTDDDIDNLPVGLFDTIIIEQDGTIIETYNPDTGETSDGINEGDGTGGDDGGDDGDDGGGD